jgi:hypothetical protein
MTYSDCDQHQSGGTAITEEACFQAARAADTRHAMHHARLEQKAKWPWRIRAE